MAALDGKNKRENQDLQIHNTHKQAAFAFLCLNCGRQVATPNSYVFEALDGNKKRENHVGMHVFDVVVFWLGTFALSSYNAMDALQCWRRLCGGVSIHNINSRFLFP